MWFHLLSPSPSPVTSPLGDIGGFHVVVERTSKMFDLPLPVVQPECFLYDFKDVSKKSVRSIPIVDYIWSEGLRIIKNPASVPAVTEDGKEIQGT